MAFFSFGKKDKNPSQSVDPVAKTPPGEPPKIQTPPPENLASGVTIPPPISSTLPSIKPPQPSGLMPAVGGGRNTITTQPMGMPPRPVSPPPPEGQKNRSTQRLVVTANAAGKMASTKPLSSGAALINLPAGMILRCLPPEMLAAPLEEFEASGAAATEVGLPMNAILSQLPSGKVELPLQDVIAGFPPGFLKPGGEIASYLESMVNLPLMDVVMRIPPDLLAVRPDQKDVDASVKRMADPFTEDAMARAAAVPVPVLPAVAPSEARIVEEGQQEAGSEEFVPQESAASPGGEPPATRPPGSATRSFIPPPRNASMPLLQETASLSGRPAARTTPMPARMIPATEEVPMPPGPRQLSASQILGVPRPTMSPPVPTPSIAGASASGPLEPRAPGAAGITPPSTVPQIPPATATTVMPAYAKPSPAPEQAPAPDANADELQRLAALAMAQIGDQPDTGPPPASDDPDAPEEKIEPGFAATSRLQVPQPSVRELAQTTAISSPAPVEPIRAPAPAEPIRLPTQAEPIRAPVASAEPAAASGVSERPFASPTGMTRATTRMASGDLPVPEPAPAEPASTDPATGAPAATAINLNNCAAEDLLAIPGLTRELADHIVQHRDKIGEFHKLEELLDVPGMTRAVYSSLTGETPASGVHPSINELLGFPLDQELSLKDVTDRIACWPDVTGCLLSQKNGLHLVGTAPDFLDKAAIVAFAPRLFEDMNKSFGEITGRETDELIIPTTGTSFHLLREKDLYLIILSRLPQMPERHLKIARFVLAGLGSRPS
jgi:DNA uptake protein ComE-like DNA-binding protein